MTERRGEESQTEEYVQKVGFPVAVLRSPSYGGKNHLVRDVGEVRYLRFVLLLRTLFPRSPRQDQPRFHFVEANWDVEGRPREPVITILLVDDHEMFREGLVRTFEREPQFQVVGESSNVADGVAQLSKNPDVVLLDVDLGSHRALDFLTECRKHCFSGKVLILTAGVSSREAMQLIEAGAVGILHKHHTTHILRSTIQDAMAGKVRLEPEYLNSLVKSVGPGHGMPRPSFSPRDRTVVNAILQGLTNREIGEQMNIAEGAVKASIHVLFNKLRVRTRAQLVRVVLEQYSHEL